MMSKAAIFALAFAAPSTATAPCMWFHSDTETGPLAARCMSTLEHVGFSSAVCTALTNAMGSWTEEDCTAIPYNKDGDKCIRHEHDLFGIQCITPEAGKFFDDPESIDLKFASASCGLNTEKGPCNDDSTCRWIEGVNGDQNCMEKQTATDMAFCRRVAEDECAGTTPPKFEELRSKDMDMFDAPKVESEEDLLRNKGEDKDQEKEKDQEKDQGKDQGGLTDEQLDEIIRKAEEQIEKDLKDLSKDLSKDQKLKDQGKDDDDTSAASHIAVSFLAVSITAVVLSL